MIVVQDSSIRNELEKRLIKDRPELLWSYDKDKVESLSNRIIINKYLSSGNSKDWSDLKQAFDKSSIKQVWEDDFLLGGFQIQRQREFVSFFFNSRNPSRYISSNKRRKIDQDIARGI